MRGIGFLGKTEETAVQVSRLKLRPSADRDRSGRSGCAFVLPVRALSRRRSRSRSSLAELTRPSAVAPAVPLKFELVVLRSGPWWRRLAAP
jgi:hypothetical protein